MLPSISGCNLNPKRYKEIQTYVWSVSTFILFYLFSFSLMLMLSCDFLFYFVSSSCLCILYSVLSFPFVCFPTFGITFLGSDSFHMCVYLQFKFPCPVAIHLIPCVRESSLHPCHCHCHCQVLLFCPCLQKFDFLFIYELYYSIRRVISSVKSDFDFVINTLF